jgi:hypothetical protein
VEERENKRKKEVGDVDRLFTGSKMFVWSLLISILEFSLRMRTTGERGWVSCGSHMIKTYF